MKTYNYEDRRAHLMNLLDSLFGKPLSDEEFIFHDRVLGELEGHMVEDGQLTWAQIIEIHEQWTPARA